MPLMLLYIHKITGGEMADMVKQWNVQWLRLTVMQKRNWLTTFVEINNIPESELNLWTDSKKGNVR